MATTDQQLVSNKIFTPANLLSLLRLLLLPVFWVLLVVNGQNFWAFLVLMIAALTDTVDGQLARATKSVSRLGIWLDPFVDRIFILVAVLAIFIVGRLPLWLLLALLLRDAMMLVVVVYQKRKYNRSFKVIFLGKLTTAMVMAGFCSLVLYWPTIPGLGLVDFSWLPGLNAAPAVLGYLLLEIGVVLSWVTAIIYLIRALIPPRRQPGDAANSMTAAPGGAPGGGQAVPNSTPGGMPAEPVGVPNGLAAPLSSGAAIAPSDGAANQSSDVR